MSINTLIKVAKKAGMLALRSYKKPVKQWYAGNEVKTIVDHEVEDYIKAELKKKYKEANFLGEEGGEEGKGNKLTFIIDPIDGTTNFFHGMPYWCTAIALFEHHVPVQAAVYDAVHDELFYARLNGGAFLNYKPISVCTKKELKHSIINVGRKPKLKQTILKHTDKVRIFGSNILSQCHVACGRLDASVLSEVRPWDIVAGALIVEEAGGKVTGLNGKPWKLNTKPIIYAPRSLHPKIVKAFKK